MSDPEAIIKAFIRDGWKSEPFERMLASVHADPLNAFLLLQTAIRHGGKSATFMDAAVSFVPENLLPELAGLSAKAYIQDNSNEVAESIIAYLSLQAPASLQPYLQTFFLGTIPNASAYYAEWPWRSASEADLTCLLESLRTAASSEERVIPFRCILESRNAQYISKALAAVDSAILPVGLGRLPHSEPAYLAEVGFDGSEKRLFNDTVLHVRFPIDILSSQSRPVWLQPTNHPTWTLSAKPGKHRFGGLADSVCAVCDGPLHNLITLDPIPDEFVAQGSRRLQIATCLSCLGWSQAPLFFQHDGNGRPLPVASEHKEPEFPACPLTEAWVELSPTPARWRWQDWALSNSRENLHRVGGHPTWIQSSEYPTCPSCRNLMPMLLQFDSNLPTQDGGEWLWGSGGICYVFWCNECRTSASLWQCT